MGPHIGTGKPLAWFWSKRGAHPRKALTVNELFEAPKARS